MSEAIFAHQGTFQPLKSGFLQIPPHDGHPCLWLNLPATGRLRDFHPTERALTGRTASPAAEQFCGGVSCILWGSQHLFYTNVRNVKLPSTRRITGGDR